MSIDGRRRPARRLLEESEQRYRSLFDYNPDAIFSLDREAHFSSVNPAAERISGYSLQELLQLRPDKLIVPEQLERTLRDFRQALAGTPSSDEVTIFHKGGHRIELELTLVPMRVEGEVAGVYGIAKDITRRRRAEADLAELLVREQEARSRAVAAEERSAFLAGASKLLAGSLDYETTLASVGRLVVPQLADWCSVDIMGDDGRVRRVVGTADVRLRERMAELLRRYAAETRTPTVAADLLAVIKTGRSEFVPEVTDAWLTGRGLNARQVEALCSLELSSYLRVPLTAREHPLGAITFAYAGSGRRYTQADLALASELADRAALAVDNARLYQEAQRALELRDQFLAAASHDLRTPVTTIKAHAQLLQRAIARAASARATAAAGQPAPPDLVSGLRSIEDAAARISAQIEELMDLSRLQSGRPLELRRTPTDLVALVRRTVAGQQQVSEQHQIEVDAERPELVGMWDGVRLERVLSNLLSNAIKYSPGGGGVLVQISAEEGPGEPEAVLRVRDHGIGIPEADAPHIFERFYRAGNVSGRPGTGIGLAGVRDIVRQHGGQIAAESHEGRGATFTVRLPLAPPEDE